MDRIIVRISITPQIEARHDHAVVVALFGMTFFFEALNCFLIVFGWLIELRKYTILFAQ